MTAEPPLEVPIDSGMRVAEGEANPEELHRLADRIEQLVQVLPLSPQEIQVDVANVRHSVSVVKTEIYEGGKPLPKGAFAVEGKRAETVPAYSYLVSIKILDKEIVGIVCSPSFSKLTEGNPPERIGVNRVLRIFVCDNDPQLVLEMNGRASATIIPGITEKDIGKIVSFLERAVEQQKDEFRRKDEATRAQNMATAAKVRGVLSGLKEPASK